MHILHVEFSQLGQSSQTVRPSVPGKFTLRIPSVVNIIAEYVRCFKYCFFCSEWCKFLGSTYMIDIDMEPLFSHLECLESLGFQSLLFQLIFRFSMYECLESFRTVTDCRYLAIS